MSLIKQVLYFDRKIDFPTTGAENVIYVALDEDYGKDYYWDGTVYKKLIGDILLYPYTNALFENITTIGDALNYLLTPDLSVSLIVTPAYAYNSETIEVNFTWVMSKNVSNISTITMTTGSGLSVIFPDLKALTTGNVGSYTKEMMISANTTFTITITDTAGNSATASDTIAFVPTTLTITDFAVSPEAGYDDGEYQLDFTATFNRIITTTDISSLTISYSGTTVDLVPYFGSGVAFDDYNLSVTGLADFVLSLSVNTGFTLAIELTNSSSDTAIVTYYAVPEVSINTFTVSGELVSGEELITMASTLLDFDTELKNLGFYSVVGTISSDALNSDITINYSTGSATRTYKRAILESDYDFTLSLVQRLGANDYRYPTSQTTTLSQLYSSISITSFDVSPFQVLIDTPTVVTFSGVVTKDLSDMIYVGIETNESGTWEEFVELTDSVSGLTFSTPQVVDIVTDVSYRVKIVEVFNGESTIVYSDEEVIMATDNLENPVYWGIGTFDSGLSEEDIMTNFTAEYIQQEENILGADVYGEDLTQVVVPFQTGDLNAIPLRIYYCWVAFPTSNPVFPEYVYAADIFANANITDLFYTDTLSLVPQISVSVTTVDYRLYVYNSKRIPVNLTFKSI